MGGLRLWPKVIIDFIVYGVDPERKYYLARTEWNASLKYVTFVFQDDLGNGYATIKATSVATYSKPVYTAYTFTSADLQIKGRVIVDRAAVYQLWNSMTLDTTNYFTPEATEFEPGTIIPAETAVLSLNKYGDSRRYQKNVKLKEGHNIRLESDDTGITITAAQNAGKGPVCADAEICNAVIDADGDGFNEKLCGLSKPIMTFGGAIADENCNIVIAGNDCIRVIKYPTENMIALHNECTEICDEEEAIRRISCRLCDLQVKMGLINASACTAICTPSFILGPTGPAPTPADNFEDSLPGPDQTIQEVATTEMPYICRSPVYVDKKGYVCRNTRILTPSDSRYGRTVEVIYHSTDLNEGVDSCPPVAVASTLRGLNNAPLETLNALNIPCVRDGYNWGGVAYEVKNNLYPNDPEKQFGVVWAGELVTAMIAAGFEFKYYERVSSPPYIVYLPYLTVHHKGKVEYTNAYLKKLAAIPGVSETGCISFFIKYTFPNTFTQNSSYVYYKHQVNIILKDYFDAGGT
jgi:hypothetical protein